MTHTVHIIFNRNITVQRGTEDKRDYQRLENGTLAIIAGVTDLYIMNHMI